LVFQDQEIAQFLNQTFINIKLTSRQGDEPELRKTYQVTGYPTVLLLKGGGTEVDRIVGFGRDRDAYFNQLKDYAAGRNTLSSYMAEYQQDSTNIDLNYNLAMKYIDHYQRATAQKYLNHILQLDPNDTKGYGEDCRFHSAVYEAQEQQDVAALATFMQQNPPERFWYTGYNELIHFYSRAKDTASVIRTYETLIVKFPQYSNYFNSYAWYIYENQLAEHYERGLEVAKQALALAPDDVNILDTVAWLYFVNDQLPDAIVLMEKALKIEPESTYLKANLKKFKESPTPT
jgi:tetratricopeptide (TPR) repeat protein